MRGIHLLGLRDANGKRLRFEVHDNTPLVIPWWIAEGDREVLLAFYQQVISNDLLLRIEVDWVRAIVPVDRQFLESERRRHGAEDRMVVVRVRRSDVDLRDVLAEPSVTAFRRVAVVCEGPARSETIGTLQQLGRTALEAAEARYETLAGEFDLRADGRVLLRPIQQQLLNPITAVETFNMLIDLHREGVPHEQHADAVLARVLRRELDALTPAEQVGLFAMAIRGEAAFTSLAGKEAAAVRAGLRDRMILRDGRLVGWAQRLTEPRHRELLEEQLERITKPSETWRMAKKVMSWFKETLRSDRSDPLRGPVLEVFRWLNEGHLQRAAQELDAIEPDLDALAVLDETRGLFLIARGRLLRNQARWLEAEISLRYALTKLATNARAATLRAVALDDLARGLRDNGRWPEAEPLFREAMNLKTEGKDTPISLGITMHELARGLRESGRWTEAEPLFRESLRLAIIGKDSPFSIGITMDHLARGLRDNGRWTEAEPLFREAIKLQTEGKDTPITGPFSHASCLGITMDHLARGLRDNGRWSEAEPIFREAIRLRTEGKDTPFGIKVTRRELAHGLIRNGQTAEGEMLLE